MFSSPQSEGEAMPAERLPMRKVREVLRLKYACGASERLIAVLATHAKVFDVAVIGVPNEEFGEEVKAVVQPCRWQDAGPELEAELIAFCRVNLSHVKSPRSIDFDRELPRHPNGKLYKRLVRDRYWAGRKGRLI
jgi:long-chain acyl-CoA synthetase